MKKRKLFLISKVSFYLFWIFLFDRWPRQVVSSIGLCRYGGRIDCCWGWARQSWGHCQREYLLPRRGGGLSTLIPGFTLHTRGLITSSTCWEGSDLGVFSYCPRLCRFPAWAICCKEPVWLLTGCSFPHWSPLSPASGFWPGKLFSLLQALRWG